MNRRKFLSIMPAAGIAGMGSTTASSTSGIHKVPAAIGTDRAYWSELLYRITKPVLQNLSRATLKKEMPLEKPAYYNTEVEKLSHLEAYGRTICGIAPWLALPDDASPEGKMRKELREYALQSAVNAVDPASPDYMNFRSLDPPLVHAAHLCQGILRAPHILWDPLDNKTKLNLITELKHLRKIRGPYNNWLLFAAMIETFFLYIGEDFEPLRIMIAVKKHQEWYVGDGWYSDGNHFAFDYYNGYVIHSMLVDILKIASEREQAQKSEYLQAVKRMQRFGIIQERMIAPDGTYPAVGRSMTYRTAAFQPLVQMALHHQLPEELSPPQVRCALTAIMKKVYGAKGTFDKNGWLQLGIVGHQPEAADAYTSTGSLYICTEGFLALGLPEQDEFWKGPAQEWTSQKIWSGKAVKRDNRWNV